jgi:hypothetical protein
LIDQAASRDTRQDELLRLVASTFDTINRQYFSGVIPTPTCRLSTRMTRCAGKVFYRSWTMGISVPYHERHGWDGELVDTIKHECIHLYLKHVNRPTGHTPEFKAICSRIGARRYAYAMPRRPYRYEWQCPHCKCTRYTRRWQSNVACGGCCQIFNHGRYARQFNFVLVRELPKEP